MLRKFFADNGFEPCPHDGTLFRRTTAKGTAYIGCYVDDICISADSDELIDEVRDMIANRFEISRGGDNIDGMIGYECEYDAYKGYAKLSTPAAIEAACEAYPVSVDTPCAAPGGTHVYAKVDHVAWRCMRGDIEVEALNQQQRIDLAAMIVGILGHVAQSNRVDIAATVSALSERVYDASQGDVQALSALLRYLWATKHYKLMLEITDVPKDDVAVYADASHATTRKGRSRTGYIVKIHGMPMVWRCSVQKSVSRSTMASEARALSEAVAAALWAKDVFEWLGGTTTGPVHAYTDNMPAVSLTQTPATGKPSTYDCVHDAFYLFERADKGQVKVQYVQGKDNVADILTKTLNPGAPVGDPADERFQPGTHQYGVQMLGVFDCVPKIPGAERQPKPQPQASGPWGLASRRGRPTHNARPPARTA